MAQKLDLRNRGTTSVDIPDNLPGTIHPFMHSNKSLFQVFIREMTGVITEKMGKKIIAFLLANIIVTVVLLFWCNSTNSMALTAYTYLTIFDIFSSLTCLVSVWVKMQKPTQRFSFGYERFEVLAVFSSTILAQLGALFIVKESVERMFEQPEVHTGRLLVGTAVAFIFHLTVHYIMENKAFEHVIAASSSSWLQEHVADMSESLCHWIPGLSKLLLPRINPFALIAFAGAMANICTYLLIDINNYYSADVFAAMWIALMTVGTMFPMAVYSGKILLQTTPSYIIGQLDKCIREASTLDGVLEFRNEHFWTLAFGSMAGSVHVRIRRDADEQMVLAHVANRLSNIISVLTVQIFKDDWSRPSSYQILGDTALLTKMSPGTSTGRISLDGSSSQFATSSRPASMNNSHLPYPNVGVGSGVNTPSSGMNYNYSYNPALKMPKAGTKENDKYSQISIPVGSKSAGNLPNSDNPMPPISLNRGTPSWSLPASGYDSGRRNFGSHSSSDAGIKPILGSNSSTTSPLGGKTWDMGASNLGLGKDQPNINLQTNDKSK